MADPVPLADQYAARRDLSHRRLGWWSPVDVVFCGPLEQAAGGGSEAAENSFLQPVGDGLKQKSLTDVDRRFGGVEALHAPKRRGIGWRSGEMKRLPNSHCLSRRWLWSPP